MSDQRGGRRKGAGRPPKSESGAGIKRTFTISPEVDARLRWAAEALDVTLVEVVEQGIEAVAEKAQKDGKRKGAE